MSFEITIDGIIQNSYSLFYFLLTLHLACPPGMLACRDFACVSLEEACLFHDQQCPLSTPVLYHFLVSFSFFFFEDTSDGSSCLSVDSSATLDEITQSVSVLENSTVRVGPSGVALELPAGSLIPSNFDINAVKLALINNNILFFNRFIFTSQNPLFSAFFLTCTSIVPSILTPTVRIEVVDGSATFVKPVNIQFPILADITPTTLASFCLGRYEVSKRGEVEGSGFDDRASQYWSGKRVGGKMELRWSTGSISLSYLFIIRQH